MLGIFHPHQYFHQVGLISHFEMRTSTVNRKKIRSYQFEVSILVLELADLGVVRETLILKTWNILDLIVYKYISFQGDLSNVLLF